MTNKNKSKCCDSSIEVLTSNEGTSYYVCVACKCLCELMTNKNTTWEEFKQQFLTKGSDCTWEIYPEPEAIKEFIEANFIPRSELEEKMRGLMKEDLYLFEHDVGFNEALDKVLEIIKL
jgi:hypothetical protein